MGSWGIALLLKIHAGIRSKAVSDLRQQGDTASHNAHQEDVRWKRLEGDPAQTRSASNDSNDRVHTVSEGWVS